MEMQFLCCLSHHPHDVHYRMQLSLMTNAADEKRG